MKKLSQAFDLHRFQQNPKLAVITRDVESRYDKAALPDEDLEVTVPTMTPEVLLGRHARPGNTEENKP